MTFCYTLTKDEIFNFHKKHFSNTKHYKNFLSQVKGLYFFLGMLVWLVVKHSMKFKVFIALVVLGIFLFIFKKKLYLYKFQYEMKKTYCDYKKKYLFNPIELTVNNEGIMLNTSMNDEVIKWKGVKDLNIIDNNVVIRTFANKNIFIPSYSIKSEEEMNLLKESFMQYGKITPKYECPED